MNETVTIEGWIARDSDGELNLFGEKPVLKRKKGRFGFFSYWSGDPWYLDDAFNRSDVMFPNLTCKNSPVKCEITIKTNNK